MKTSTRIALVLSVLAGASASAWDANGHRAIALRALDALPSDAPSFLREADTRAMIASQACEPDRWRVTTLPELMHLNNPDHYINIEVLSKAGLSLEGLPRLRTEYTDLMATARVQHPEAFEPRDDAKDPGRARMTAGQLPYAIVENFAKLQVQFKTLRMLESLNEPVRKPQVDQVRSQILVTMGLLAHFVADGAQPLHTTIHHHGWVGDNPHGYTARYSFHAEIDGGVLDRHALNYDAIKAVPLSDAAADAANPSVGVRAFLGRSFGKVEPLYALEHDGKLLGDEGKAFIVGCLTDGAAELSALYAAAWATSAPTDEDIRKFVFYDKYEGANPAPGAK